MSAEIKINDYFKEVKKEVDTVKNNSNLPLEKILSNSFMEKHTKFSSFSEMLKAANLTPDMLKDIDEASKKEFDKFISENTSFASWEQLAQAAMQNLLGGGR